MSAPTRSGYHRRYIPLRSADPEDDNWKTQAACRGLDPDAWFPHFRSQAGFGKRICKNCPVKQDCLDVSLATEELYGTLGGLSQWERAEMLKKKWRR